MVAPSCCLEYRPTAVFWAILVFIVFPIIFLSGKVIGCALCVAGRVLKATFRLVLWDEADYLEEAEYKRELERMKRRVERERQREMRKTLRKKILREVKEEQEKTEKITTILANPITSKKFKDKEDNSDSLISECDDENSSATATTAGLSTGSVQQSHGTEHRSRPNGIVTSSS